MDTPFRVASVRRRVYDRVLHPTDGSDGAEYATEHAIAIAERFEVPIHVLFAVDTSNIQATDAYATSTYEATVEALEAEGQNRIEQVRARADAAGVAVTDDVLTGAPANTITDTAEPGDAIVMGTHGRSGLDRYLIGSTTEKVVRTADVPVVTVPLSEEGSPPSGT